MLKGSQPTPISVSGSQCFQVPSGAFWMLLPGLVGPAPVRSWAGSVRRLVTKWQGSIRLSDVHSCKVNRRWRLHQQWHLIIPKPARFTCRPCESGMWAYDPLWAFVGTREESTRDSGLNWSYEPGLQTMCELALASQKLAIVFKSLCSQSAKSQVLLQKSQRHRSGIFGARKKSQRSFNQARNE